MTDIIDRRDPAPPTLGALVPPAVRVRRLSKSFGSRRVLDDLDLDVGPGEITVLIGASGCGKTTLLRVLGQLDTDVGGTVEVPRAKAIVYQEPRLLPWRRAWQNVAIGLPRQSGRRAAFAALDEVGLSGREDSWPNVLSGGEAARVSLARALVREPDVILLDEPFASLDALTRIRMHGLLLRLWERHHPAVVMVTHDVDEAVALADRVLVMAAGRIAHEVRVEPARPRRRSGVPETEIRSRLFGLLGVDDA